MYLSSSAVAWLEESYCIGSILERHSRAWQRYRRYCTRHESEMDGEREGAEGDEMSTLFMELPAGRWDLHDVETNQTETWGFVESTSCYVESPTRCWDVRDVETNKIDTWSFVDSTSCYGKSPTRCWDIHDIEMNRAKIWSFVESTSCYVELPITLLRVSTWDTRDVEINQPEIWSFPELETVGDFPGPP